MFKVNSNKVETVKFPDGTHGIFNLSVPSSQLFQISSFFSGNVEKYCIKWLYESDEDYIILKYIVDHIREKSYKAEIQLTMPYVPNARMDRTKSNNEVFTLKYFANFINSLNLDKVVIFDPHSDVTPALINNVDIINPGIMIYKVIDKIKDKQFVVYFPDYGAKKRYSDCFNIFKTDGYDYDIVYGVKNRDWETGKIVGLDICDADGINLKYSVNFKDVLKDKTVLMVDDIVSYGGTLAYSADKLKEFECGDIYSYVSHTDNSVLDEEKGKLLERLKNGTVKKVFTTDSLYTGDSEYIDVIYNFF